MRIYLLDFSKVEEEEFGTDVVSISYDHPSCLVERAIIQTRHVPSCFLAEPLLGDERARVFTRIQTSLGGLIETSGLRVNGGVEGETKLQATLQSGQTCLLCSYACAYVRVFKGEYNCVYILYIYSMRQQNAYALDTGM